MIINKIQLNRAKKFVEKLKLELKSIEESEELSTIRREMYMSAQNALVNSLESEITEYEFLISESLEILQGFSLIDLGGKLIQIRIALGLTQSELGEKVGMKAQQIQRYEKNNYENCTWISLCKVISVLDVSMNLEKIVLNKTVYKLPENIDPMRLDSIRQKTRNCRPLLEIITS